LVFDCGTKQTEAVSGKSRSLLATEITSVVIFTAGNSDALQTNMAKVAG